MPGSTFFPFARDQIGGAIVVNVFAILSALALLLVAFRIIWLVSLRFLKRLMEDSKEYIFFTSQLGYYAACLLLGNLLNSIAGLMGIPSLLRGGIVQDDYCQVQGYIMQVGNVSTAYFTTALGVHTFNSLALQKRKSVVVYTVAISVGWILAGTLAAIPFFLPRPNGVIYGVSGLSCGIRNAYPKTQFLLHLLPIFITAFVSAVSYAVIFLVLRGTLVIKGGLRQDLNPGERGNERFDGYRKFIAIIAKSMIWYPVAFVLLLVPYSVTRLFGLAGFAIPFQAAVFAFTCWFLLGVVNVLLLYNTLRVLSPAIDCRNSVKDSEGRRLSEYPSQYQEKGMLYPFAAVSPAPTDMSGFGSDRHLLPSYLERTASISSYYTYPIGTFSVGANIAPVSTLNDNISIIPALRRDSLMSPVAQPGTSPTVHSVWVHSRDNSTGTEPLHGLPPPPRRSRTPPTTQPTNRSPTTTSSTAVGSQPTGSISPISIRIPSPTWQRDHSASTLSEELDVAGWLAKQNPDGSMPRRSKSKPLGSALGSSFPGPPSSGFWSSPSSPERDGRGSGASPLASARPKPGYI